MKMYTHFTLGCILLLALSSTTYAAIYEQLSGNDGTCGRKVEVENLAECDRAVQMISDYSGVQKHTQVWHGHASWIFHGCGIQYHQGKFMRVFNYANGRNNGHYKKVCNSKVKTDPEVKTALDEGGQKGALEDGFKVSFSTKAGYPQCYKDPKLTANINNGWCANIHEPGQWLEIDAEKLVSWNSITTKGKKNQYTKTYRIEFTKDGKTWFHYNKMQPFQANKDFDTPVTHKFAKPIFARKIRIVVLSWHGAIAMRVEVYYSKEQGFSLSLLQTNALCTMGVRELAEVNGAGMFARDWKGSASIIPKKCSIQIVNGEYMVHFNTKLWGARNNGHYKKICMNSRAPFIVTAGPRQAWCALSARKYEWVQVESPTAVSWTRVETKARNFGSWNQRVTGYYVKVSDNGSTLKRAIVTRSTTLQGNLDATNSKINVFDPPLNGKMLRIEVQTWYGHPSMKFEAYYKQIAANVSYDPPSILIGSSTTEKVAEDKEYYKVADNNANLCRNNGKINTETECQIAFLKVAATETLKANEYTWRGWERNAPPGCSITTTKGKLFRAWNVMSGRNNGKYNILCIGKATDATVAATAKTEHAAVAEGCEVTFSSTHSGCTSGYKLSSPRSAGWCASYGKPNEWVMIKAPHEVSWTKLAMLGRTFGRNHKQYIRTFKIKLSNDGKNLADTSKFIFSNIMATLQ